MEDSRGQHSVNSACAWEGDTLSRPKIRVFSFNGWKGGRATSLTVSFVGKTAPVEVHFTCNAENRLQSVQFDAALRERDANEGKLSVAARAEVVWK